MAKDERISAPKGHPAASLDYVSDDSAGIRRIRKGTGFSYRSPDGRLLSRNERLRVQRLGIPPAYQDVWICPNPNGHLQATGRDMRGRKQYRYHPLWSSAQSETKYADLVRFAEALPVIRQHVKSAVSGRAGDRDFTLAAIIMLLDQAYLRVGNEAYTAQNRSFGATTLLRRHLTFHDGAVLLSFRAKGGKSVRQVLRDKRLHRILQDIHELPGRRLFTYLDDDGTSRVISSSDVNSHISDLTGICATAKTFRTWGGTLAAFRHALGAGPVDQITLRGLSSAAADVLHNTPTICRKSYIHPAVLDLAEMQPGERHTLLDGLASDEPHGLHPDERKLFALLQSAANST